MHADVRAHGGSERPRLRRCQVCVSDFVRACLGEAFSESRPLDVAAVADEVDPHTIVLFILSLGADPTTLVEALAKRRKVRPLI